MSESLKSLLITIPQSLFDKYDCGKFEELLKFFDWSLRDKKISFLFKSGTYSDIFICLLHLYWMYLIDNKCKLKISVRQSVYDVEQIEHFNSQKWDSLLNESQNLLKLPIRPLYIFNSSDQTKTLDFWDKYSENFSLGYQKVIRYVISEILYNTTEHGKNGNLPSVLQFLWEEETREISFTIADLGIGIRKHLRYTYPNLATDPEAIRYSIEPKVSGTFQKSKMNYETKNNAGVGLFISSKIIQKLKADMFIVSGNGFIHISSNEIIENELNHQWNGTFVYVKIKTDLIKDLNAENMISEIRKEIESKTNADNSAKNIILYIHIRNYFGRYAEDKDRAKKIRDEKILPALAENKTITLDFEEIISAPHSLLNAMLATPIERLGLAAYKKIKIINAAPEIRETLDFIFDDNTSNS